jgi:hypothetical protein
MSEGDDDYGGLTTPQEAPLGEDEDEVEPLVFLAAI